tara:strand:+ start:283 stop:468 length:186 start_codon:yes stop_codon:yes gene_type:complete
MKRKDKDFIGVYHPFPNEAPLHWRKANMEIVKEKNDKAKKRKEKKIINRVLKKLKNLKKTP